MPPRWASCSRYQANSPRRPAVRRSQPRTRANPSCPMLLMARAQLHHEIKLTGAVLHAWHALVLQKRQRSARSHTLSSLPQQKSKNCASRDVCWVSRVTSSGVLERQLLTAEQLWRSSSLAKAIWRWRTIGSGGFSFGMKTLMQDAACRLAAARGTFGTAERGEEGSRATLLWTKSSVPQDYLLSEGTSMKGQIDDTSAHRILRAGASFREQAHEGGARSGRESKERASDMARRAHCATMARAT